jgi:hypothetical protein
MAILDPAPAVSTPPLDTSNAADPAVAATPVDALAAAMDPVVSAPAAAPAVVAEAPVRPEGLPDSFWDAATGVKTTEAVARLVELETAAAARAADVPADVAGYKLEAAEPITDPTTGKAVSFNAEDPLAKSALAWAHENGVGQAALSKLLGVFAGNEMAALKAHTDHVAAETAKLGANHEARITALSSALAKHGGEAGAKAIMGNLGTADAVVALEAVVKALAGPSLGTPPVAAAKASLGDLSGVDLLAASLT